MENKRDWALTFLALTVYAIFKQLENFYQRACMSLYGLTCPLPDSYNASSPDCFKLKR